MGANGRLEPLQPQEDFDLVGRYLEQVSRTKLLTAIEEVELAKRIEAGVYADRLLHGDGDLTPDRIAELEAVSADGQLAKDHMIRANLRLVVTVAKRFSWSELAFLDLIQEGNLGLIRAVEKFDYTKGNKFSTYAMWWIRQAIHRGIAGTERTVRLPIHVVDELTRVRRAEGQLEVVLGRRPTTAEIADETAMSAQRVRELKRHQGAMMSLETPVGDSKDTQIGDLIVDPHSADEALGLLESQALREELRSVVDTLPPREALVMSLRYGLTDGRPRTPGEIAEHLGITRGRVRQLERRSITYLRDPERHRSLLTWSG
jgi:RNA polymerase primary sigma factor/RNA polymerase nonessential primary-like sigma factor